MIGHSLDSADSWERNALRGKSPGTVMVQRARQNQQRSGNKGTRQTRLSAEDVMTFWNCMVPCGWSLGGLVAFLLKRKLTSAGHTGGKTSALRAILFGLLSTLCYLIALRHAESSGINQRSERTEADTPGKEYILGQTHTQ